MLSKNTTFHVLIIWKSLGLFPVEGHYKTSVWVNPATLKLGVVDPPLLPIWSASTVAYRSFAKAPLPMPEGLSDFLLATFHMLDLLNYLQKYSQPLTVGYILLAVQITILSFTTKHLVRIGGAWMSSQAEFTINQQPGRIYADDKNVCMFKPSSLPGSLWP